MLMESAFTRRPHRGDSTHWPISTPVQTLITYDTKLLARQIDEI